jgi:hypothetical protein
MLPCTEICCTVFRFLGGTLTQTLELYVTQTDRQLCKNSPTSTQSLNKQRFNTNFSSPWCHVRASKNTVQRGSRQIAQGRAIEVSPNQFTAIPFSVSKRLIKKQLELRYQARWTACTGCRQFKMLMRYPLPSTANELLAMSKVRLRAAVGLLTGHTCLRAHLYKFGHAERHKKPTVRIW